MPTAEEFAQYIKLAKPYIPELEKMVQEVEYGELDIRFSVRRGVVEKMVIITSKTWLKKGSESSL